MDLNLNAQQVNDDDEIIELTEIIEKGNATAAPSPSGEQDIFGPAMEDLGGGKVPDLPSDMDVDLDALLAQMDSDGGFSQAEEAERVRLEAEAQAMAAASEDSEIDAMISEEFGAGETDVTPEEAAQGFGESDFPSGDFPGGDLPDMADIDALIADMDMPEQPVADVHTSVDEGDSADQMDALLESILDDTPTASAAPASAPATSAEDEDAGDGLDALFNSIMNDEPVTEPVAEPVAPVAPVAPAAPAPTAAPEPVDVSTLNFGTENPTATVAPAPVDDFDALFQDVLGDAPLSAADVAKAVVESSQQSSVEVIEPEVSPQDDTELLDMLFGQDDLSQTVATPAVSTSAMDFATQITPEVASEAKKSEEDVKSVLDMLDEFLPSAPEEGASLEKDSDDFMDFMSEVVEPSESEVSDDMLEDSLDDIADDGLDADLDAIMGEDIFAPVAESVTEPVTASSPSSPSNVAPTLDEMAVMAAAATAASVAAGTATASPHVSHAEQEQRFESLEQRLGLVEEQVTQTFGDMTEQHAEAMQSAKTHMQSLQDAVDAQELRMAAVEAYVQSEKEAAEEAAEHAAERAAQEMAEWATEQAAQEAVEQAAQEFAQEAAQETTQDVGALQGLEQEPELSAESAAPSDSHGVNSHIIEQVQQDFEALRAEVAAQAERIAQAEELSQTVARDAGARDMAAREALSSYIDKLEAVAKEAVSRETAAHEDVQSTMQKLEQALQDQEELSKAYAKRITDLEERLQGFEKAVEENLERMAVAAAAKILREEIAALMAEG